MRGSCPSGSDVSPAMACEYTCDRSVNRIQSTVCLSDCGLRRTNDRNPRPCKLCTVLPAQAGRNGAEVRDNARVTPSLVQVGRTSRIRTISSVADRAAQLNRADAPLVGVCHERQATLYRHHCPIRSASSGAPLPPGPCRQFSSPCRTVSRMLSGCCHVHPRSTSSSVTSRVPRTQVAAPRTTRHGRSRIHPT